MPDYYKVDVRVLGFGEQWRLVRSPIVLLLWAAKILRFPLPGSSSIAEPVPVREQEVPPKAFAEECRRHLQQVAAELQTLGFEAPYFYTLKESLVIGELGAAVLRHSSGEAFALISHLSVQGPAARIIEKAVAFITPRWDGTFIGTTNARPVLKGPPGNAGLNLPQAAVPDLWIAHQRQLEPARPTGGLKRVESREATLASLDQLERQNFEFHRHRGHYVPMTPAEVESARRLKLASLPTPAPAASAVASEAPVPPLPAAGFSEPVAASAIAVSGPVELTPEDRVVLEHMRQLQDKPPGSWGGALLVLVVSVALFLGLGSASWSWEFSLMLVPILFFHELGHYVAMRLFGYRNLKMFFIPLFGAAVSGQHYNVPGWKKVVVSLAGPVPGILAGAVIGAIGVMTERDWMLHAAYLTLFINGFNLLPVLPLDGGWVLQATLFSRHHLLNVAFHALAALSLIGGSFFLEGSLLMYVGIAMLVGLPATVRLSQTTSSLRRRRLAETSTDAQTVPHETAVAIVRELRERFKTGQTPKSLAQLALTTFENLNARPPGWLASFALLGVHAGSVVMAAVFAMFFLVARQGNVMDFLDLAATAPRQVYECDSLVEWRGGGFAQTEDRQTVTYIADFPADVAAAQAREALTPRLPSESALRQFGQTLLVALPLERADLRSGLFPMLEAHSTNVFAATTNFAWAVSVACIAPDAETAAQLEQQLTGYLSSPDPRALITPWHPDDPRPPGDRLRHEQARIALVELNEFPAGIHTNAELSALIRRSAVARRRGDDLAAEQLEREVAELQSRLRNEALDRRQAEASPGPEAEMILLFRALPDPTIDLAGNLAARETLLPMLGRLADLPAEPGPDPGVYGATGGFVLRSGMAVNINFLRFEAPYFGAPALAEWLCDQGCLDVKYAFTAFGFGDREADLEE